MGESSFTTRYLKDRAKDCGIINGRTIPPPVSKLPLALMNACLGTPAHTAHVILVKLTQFSLARGKTRDLRAQRLCPYQVNLGVAPHLISLETKVHPGSDESSEGGRGEAD